MSVRNAMLAEEVQAALLAFVSTLEERDLSLDSVTITRYEDLEPARLDEKYGSIFGIPLHVKTVFRLKGKENA